MIAYSDHNIMSAQPDRTAAVEAGRSRRASVSRRAQGEWTPAASRENAVETISSEIRTLVPSLVPLRLQRMSTSPFAFFRGAAAVMARDIARLPATNIEIQVCGDAHLANFGAFATPERSLVFDINDFDETVVGCWEWDLKRFATSIELVSREAGHSALAARDAVRQAVQTYIAETRRHARIPALQSWHEAIDAREITARVGPTDRRFVERELERARTHTSLELFPKLTVSTAAGLPRIVERPPLITRVDAAELEAAAAIEESYRSSLPVQRRILLDRFMLIDLAMKVVGVGSVGTRCYVALLLDDVGDPLFLQIKEARSSVWRRDAGGESRDDLDAGERVVVGQRVMQAASDEFLGWTADGERFFYVRQLADMKRAPRLETMSARRLSDYGALCARALARGHSRSGRAAQIAGYVGTSSTFCDAICDFARVYARQTRRDHHDFVDAVKDGNFPAITP